MPRFPAPLLVLALLFGLLIILSACLPVPQSPLSQTPSATSTPCDCVEKRYATDTPTPGPQPTEPAPTPEAPRVSLPAYLPQYLRESLELPENALLIETEEEGAVRFDVIIAPPKESKTVEWVYALAAPFHTVTDAVTLKEIQDFWSGKSRSDLPFKTLLVDEATKQIFERKWGAAGQSVRALPSGSILDAAWKEEGVWAFVPFEALEPRWKVILVDDQSPVRKAFDPSTYGLTVHFGWEGLEQSSLSLPESNRRADRLTTVMLTGVTALVRGTASLMEREGMTYPASDTGPWLRDADILHINNEVPFARNCPQPYDWVGLVFCSQEEYIQLLEDVGADVIELTGDHFQDWGPEAMLFTLDLYKERGWQTYGGGANKLDAAEPALFEHNGNRIAFLGCNGKPPGYATASETTPGALHCDMDDMAQRVRALKAEGYLPIFTFQHLEYYQYVAHPLLQVDFQKVADAGAVIVSGSQAHQPHAFEFRGGSFLHYGLGNLFFDQTNQGDPPRTAFIDRHVIYDGKHISTELLTIYFVDYARAREMTPEERAALLQTVFDASTW